MRKTLVLLLAVTAGLIACDSPTEMELGWVEGLNLPLNFSLIPSVGDSISFRLAESANRTCQPRLEVSASLEGNELRIDVKNWVFTYPKGCFGLADLPARWWHSFPFGPGTEGVYDVSIHLQNQSDHYHLVVEEDSCWLSGVDGQFSRISGASVTRDSGL